MGWEFFPIIFESLPPEKPVCVSPLNSSTGVLKNAGLEWADPGSETNHAATGFNLYFSTSIAGLVQIGEAHESDAVTETASNLLAPDSLYGEGITYYWRVDAFNDAGTTTGDVWSFTVEQFSFPPDRPDDYDPDIGGGGRYNQKLIVVGHKCIYVGSEE
jgi:hypothetical protein